MYLPDISVSACVSECTLTHSRAHFKYLTRVLLTILFVLISSYNRLPLSQVNFVFIQMSYNLDFNIQPTDSYSTINTMTLAPKRHETLQV